MLARKELGEISLNLLDMADYIKKHGWCQFCFTDPWGKVCLIGAARETLEDDRFKTMAKLNEYLDGSIMLWNDAKGRTQKEVIDMLHEAAYTIEE